MINRCNKCGKLIPPEDEVTQGGDDYHKRCFHIISAHKKYPKGKELFDKICKNIEYLSECDPMDLLGNEEKLEKIFNSFGFDSTQDNFAEICIVDSLDYSEWDLVDDTRDDHL